MLHADTDEEVRELSWARAGLGKEPVVNMDFFAGLEVANEPQARPLPCPVGLVLGTAGAEQGSITVLSALTGCDACSAYALLGKRTGTRGSAGQVAGTITSMQGFGHRGRCAAPLWRV